MRPRRVADLFAGLPVAQAALEFAITLHADQYREIDQAPFIIHPIEVGVGGDAQEYSAQR